MLLASFPAGPWQTNCYVVATGPGEECLIIDPGFEAQAGLRELIGEHRLKPVAVVLTHGHLDHLFSVTPVCKSYASSCWIHRRDRALLSDPWRAMGPETRVMVEHLTGHRVTFTEPDDVHDLVDGARVELAGLALDVLHAPGHTPGSVMYTTPYADSEAVDEVVFTGDVLFAGSIGRTDLPGGDPGAMLQSLRTKVLPLPDSAAVLPGHGPQTTMARERTHNPYLQPSALS
jgi:hydroxyacylglutathione hydrolase